MCPGTAEMAVRTWLTKHKSGKEAEFLRGYWPLGLNICGAIIDAIDRMADSGEIARVDEYIQLAW